MWRIDEQGSGRNLRGHQSVLRVNTKLRKERGRDNGTLALVVVGLAAALLLVLLWYGILTAGRRLFSENGAYAIRRIELKTGEQVPVELAREYLARMNVQEGTNLFAVDIAMIREEFLKKMPAVRNVEVSRRLPDRLVVQIEERVPLAMIGGIGAFVVDREGQVFPNRWRGRSLPTLSGFTSVRLMPGVKLSRLGLAALQVVEACASPEVGIDVKDIDVEQREYLVLKVGDDDKKVKLSWPKMGDTSSDALSVMRTRLARVAKVLQTDEGKAAPVLDATYEDRVYAQGIEAGTTQRQEPPPTFRRTSSSSGARRPR